MVGGVSAQATAEWAPAEVRERFIESATRIATERGLRGVDRETVARSAGLSTEDFDLHFENVEQCLLAAFDRFLERMLEHVAEACEDIEDWSMRVRASIRAVFEFIAEVEPVARLFAIDAVRVGPAGIERRYASIERAASQLKQGRLLYPPAAGLPDALEQVLIAGVVVIVCGHLLGDEGEMLAEVEPEAIEMVLSPYIGTEEARLAASA